MISIIKDQNKLDQLAKDYLAEVKSYFNISEKNRLQTISKGKRSLEFRMIRYFNDNLEKIILCAPSDLKKMHVDFIAALNVNLEGDNQHRNQFKAFKERMEKYYKYLFKKMINKDQEEISIGRWLAKKLEINVCPYCNHNYTLTVNDEKNKVNFRPEFDHFLPKSTHPILALSFYNLVPSCSVCNKLKSSKAVIYTPYNLTEYAPITFKFYGCNKEQINNDDEDMIDEQLLGLGKNYDSIYIKAVSENSSTSHDCNIKVLGIQQVYNHQTDYVKEIMDKAQQYNKSSYEGLVNSFKGLGKTEAEIDRIIWSAYLDDHSKRPLSKLTHDLLIQLGLKNG